MCFFEEGINHGYYGSKTVLIWPSCWKKGYEVHGIKRRSSLFNTGRVDHIYQDRHENNPRFPALR